MKNILLYGFVLAALVVLLELVQYRFVILHNAVEIYVAIVAIVFITVGLYMGRKLSRPKEIIIEKLIALPVQQGVPFVVNDILLERLGISKREHEILLLIAEGLSNQEIADRIFLSINTVKTHVSNLLLKLDVKRRAQAIQRARELSLVP